MKTLNAFLRCELQRTELTDTLSGICFTVSVLSSICLMAVVLLS
jgi:hypothetical protein